MDDEAIVAEADALDNLLVEVPGQGLLEAVQRLPMCVGSQGLPINKLTDKHGEERALYDLECLNHARMLHSGEHLNFSVSLPLVARTLIENLNRDSQIRITVGCLPNSCRSPSAKVLRNLVLSAERTTR